MNPSPYIQAFNIEVPRSVGKGAYRTSKKQLTPIDTGIIRVVTTEQIKRCLEVYCCCDSVGHSLVAGDITRNLGGLLMDGCCQISNFSTFRMIGIRGFHRNPVFAISSRWASISSELTPNPDATIFWIDQKNDVLGPNAKTISFKDRYSCAISPIAGALFKVNGVSSVMLGSNYITVSKKSDFDWQVVKPSIELVLSQFIDSGIPLIRPDAIERTDVPKSSPTPQKGDITSTTEDEIKRLIAERVQPFVQQDGGDIEFVSFDEKSGVVYVHMQGACKGCPKSMITLKLGIERMLKHYIPDVVGVIDVGSTSDADDKEASKEFGP